MSQQALAAFPDPLLPLGRKAFQTDLVYGDSSGGGFRFRHGIEKIQLPQALHNEVDTGSHAEHPVDGRPEQPIATDRRPTAFQDLGAQSGRRHSPHQSTVAGLELSDLALLQVESVGEGNHHSLGLGVRG